MLAMLASDLAIIACIVISMAVLAMAAHETRTGIGGRNARRGVSGAECDLEARRAHNPEAAGSSPAAPISSQSVGNEVQHASGVAGKREDWFQISQPGFRTP